MHPPPDKFRKTSGLHVRLQLQERTDSTGACGARGSKRPGNSATRGPENGRGENMSSPKPQSILREASHQIAAGGSAGLVEICLMHPLDVVKTRFQIQRGTSDPNSYKSLGDCFRTIFRNEG
ncbi:hypothetical protein F2P81_003146, partial [Scophthalmus maximus]